MSMIKKQVVYAALEGIDKAIERLWKPMGTATVIDPGVLLGQPTPSTHADQRPQGTYNMHVMGLDDYGRKGQPPRLWPEVIELTETFIGAAFVIAQEHIGDPGKVAQFRDVCDVANYWKHRGSWNNQWTVTGPKDPGRHTKAGIERISGGTFPTKPPMEVGVLGELAAIVLKRPFDTHQLWMAIQHIP